MALKPMSSYLADLVSQKSDLVALLQDCGIEASEDEKLNTLIPKLSNALRAFYEFESWRTNGFTDFSQYYGVEYQRANTLGSSNQYGKIYGYVRPSVVFPPAKTSKATMFMNTFYQQSSLSEAPEFDTSSGEDFTQMFYGCKSLVEVPLYNTSKAKRLGAMFQDCTNLKNIPAFDTSNTENFMNFAQGCGKLTEAPELNTSKAVNINRMFYQCKGLKSIPEFDFSNVEDAQNAFYDCSALTSIPPLDLSKATNVASLFQGCTNLKNLPESFDFTNATDIYQAFYKCSSLTSVPRLYLAEEKVKSLSGLFGYCTNLEGEILWLPKPNFTNTYPYTNIIAQCPKITAIGTIYLRSDTTLGTCFAGCTSLETIVFEGTLCTTGFNISTCTALSHDTLSSIVDILKDYSGDTSGKTYKITFGATNLAKLTTEEKQIMDDKGWTYA